PTQTIFISDPVAGVTYSLDSKSHTAHKGLPFTFEFARKQGETIEGRTFEFKVAPGAAAGPGSGNVIMTAPLPAPGPGVRVAHAAEGVSTFVFKSKPASSNEVKEE